MVTTRVDTALQALVESGDVAPPRRSKVEWTWRPRGAGLPEHTATRLLDELRADRPGGGES
jgi:hypothetical protein